MSSEKLPKEIFKDWDVLFSKTSYTTSGIVEEEVNT